MIARSTSIPTKKVHTYSKGNRQKVLLVGALMVGPRLLVLDEPTSGLDPLMEQAFRRCIQEAQDGARPSSSRPTSERSRGAL